MNELEWFPMETAPRNNTLIVIRLKNSAFPFVAYWGPAFKTWTVPCFEKDQFPLRYITVAPDETDMIGWAPIPQITRAMIFSDREQ